jgi:hypothetical protein
MRSANLADSWKPLLQKATPPSGEDVRDAFRTDCGIYFPRSEPSNLANASRSFHLFTKLRHDTLVCRCIQVDHSLYLTCHQMAEHPQPEMMRLSLSDLALRIKIMKVQLGTSIEDVLTRALDPPSTINIQRAVAALVEVRHCHIFYFYS